MTTVASDGKTIAADTYATDTFKFQIPDSKIYYIRGSWVGFCGDCGAIERMREWMEMGAPPTNRPSLYGKEAWGALELDPDGKLWLWESDGRRFPSPAPMAIGSGCDFAMGAMCAGTDAAQAVEIACTLDPYSGGDIHVAEAGVAPDTKKKRGRPKKTNRA